MAKSKSPPKKDENHACRSRGFKRSAGKQLQLNDDSSDDNLDESVGTCNVSRNVHLTGLRSTENFENNQHLTAPKRIKSNDAFKKPCGWMSKDYKVIAECNTDSLKSFVDDQNVPDGAVSSRLKKFNIKNSFIFNFFFSIIRNISI